jgi:hypothetical protein
MTAPHVIDPARFLSEQLGQPSPDLMRSMLATFINALMSAEADAVCGAEYGARSQARTNSRNGYRHRDFAPEPWTSPSPGCARGRISRTGCSNAAAAPRPP